MHSSSSTECARVSCTHLNGCVWQVRRTRDLDSVSLGLPIFAHVSRYLMDLLIASTSFTALGQQWLTLPDDIKNILVAKIAAYSPWHPQEAHPLLSMLAIRLSHISIKPTRSRQCSIYWCNRHGNNTFAMVWARLSTYRKTHALKRCKWFMKWRRNVDAREWLSIATIAVNYNHMQQNEIVSYWIHSIVPIKVSRWLDNHLMQPGVILRLFRDMVQVLDDLVQESNLCSTRLGLIESSQGHNGSTDDHRHYNT